MTHPACCTSLDLAWPLPCPLPATRLVRTGFDAALLDAADFAALGLAIPKGIPKRQAEYLAGRVCAREALRQLTGTPGLPTRDSEGAPCWPAGVVGSISHGHGLASAVVGCSSQWQGLGLDLEALIPATRADRLASQILTAGEQKRLAGLADPQRALQITLTFSLKESLFKALFPLVRTRFYFHDAELVGQADGQARLRLLKPLAAAWPAGRELDGQFTLSDGFLLTLVSIPAAAPNIRETPHFA